MDDQYELIVEKVQTATSNFKNELVKLAKQGNITYGEAIQFLNLKNKSAIWYSDIVLCKLIEESIKLLEKEKNSFPIK